MGCAEFGPQLAIFRELSPAEREQLQAHLATCPDCAATLVTYMEQDRFLSALPVLRPSPKLRAAVLARTVDRHRLSRAPAWRWASAALVTLLVFLVVMGGTISVAAEALPGDALYPVKRTVEEVRLTFTFNPAARESYEQLLVMTRLEETQKVLQQGREADVEFQGRLEATTDGGWAVEGVKVQIAPEAWGQTPSQPGAVVMIEGRAAGGQLTARRVSVVPPKPVTPARRVSPSASPQPSPTTVPSEATAVPTPAPSATEQSEPLPTPSLTLDISPARLTRTPRVVPVTVEPTPKPEDKEPTIEPSATADSSESPLPRPWRTRLPRPTVRPTRTPTSAEPYPLPTRTPWVRPTRTPRIPWPTPKPTLTPEASQPTPLPTRTPRVPWRTPKPSPTPGSPEPTRLPSRTPRISWPSPTATPLQNQPAPTSTPAPPTATPERPRPTKTPRPPEPTPTPLIPTPTAVPPTATPVPPTATPVPPTATPQPETTPTCPCGS